MKWGYGAPSHVVFWEELFLGGGSFLYVQPFTHSMSILGGWCAVRAEGKEVGLVDGEGRIGVNRSPLFQ